jgi:symplekin
MDSLGQLQAARNLALGDGRYYPTIIPGVLPIIGANANASIEVQRWGADFLAETFASPTWAPDAKATTSLTVLPILKEFVEAQDAAIVKSAVQAAACIYPLVYRHMYVIPSLASCIHAMRPWAQAIHFSLPLPVVVFSSSPVRTPSHT